MSEKKEFVGITENRCDFQGKVVSDPVYFEVPDGEGAFFKIKTFVPEFQAGGQRADVPMEIPITNMDPRRTANVIKKYVSVGKEVKIGAYYKPWVDGQGVEQHSLVMTYIKLGHGPFQKAGSTTPPLPAS